ncbi:MAG: hypothetical protein WC210_08870 [Candidatus Neomarinimicrobiota bacterium]
MSTFSFKSVGTTRTDQITNAINKTVTPFGITTPIQIGSSDFFKTNMTLMTQIADNFRNLIMTNWGERIMLYDFGANLRQVLSNFNDDEEFDSNAMRLISESVAKWMPYINLDNYASEFYTVATNKFVKIKISYTVPTLSQNEHAIEVTLKVM